MLLEINGLCFSRNGTPAIRDVDIVLESGNVLIVVGPSGCGKSTLLRLISGLEVPTAGSITVGGKVLVDPATFLPPESRPIGMVFQGLALFPHLTVAENVGFGLHRLSKSERRQRVLDELRSVGLEGLESRYPHQLSGGEQQRVAIARAMVLHPQLLLMDEPFSDLDGRTRMKVRSEVQRILQAHGTTAIIVSHDREDAYHLGDHIAEMEDGRIVRTGTALEFREDWSQHPFTP